MESILDKTKKDPVQYIKVSSTLHKIELFEKTKEDHVSSPLKNNILEEYRDSSRGKNDKECF